MLPTPLTIESLFGTLFDPEIWADPYPLYAELRESGRVLPLGDSRWVVSGHAQARALLQHRGVSSDERRGTPYAPGVDDPYPPIMREVFLFADPPDHTRLRNLVVRAFTPRQVRSIEPRAARIVEGLLDEAHGRGTFDVVADFAQPLAIEIICELLGVPFSDRARFGSWGDPLARLIDPGALRTAEQDAVAARAAEAFAEYFDELIEARRVAPGDDLLSELITAEEHGDRLTKRELVSVCLLLLVAGFETTINLIGNGFVALMQNRESFDRLVAQPDLAGGAVNEFLRIDSPVQMTVRIAVEELELGGQRIPRGDSVINLLAAANHDPRVFDNPAVLDIGRDPNQHLAFGGGIHHCLGAALARTEAVAAFRGLVSRLADLELVEAVRRPTFTLRGYSSVVARFASPRG